MALIVVPTSELRLRTPWGQAPDGAWPRLLAAAYPASTSAAARAARR